MWGLTLEILFRCSIYLKNRLSFFAPTDFVLVHNGGGAGIDFLKILTNCKRINHCMKEKNQMNQF